MRPSLLAEKRVDTPAAVEPDVYPGAADPRKNLDQRNRCHLGI